MHRTPRRPGFLTERAAAARSDARAHATRPDCAAADAVTGSGAKLAGRVPAETARGSRLAIAPECGQHTANRPQ